MPLAIVFGLRSSWRILQSGQINYIFDRKQTNWRGFDVDSHYVYRLEHCHRSDISADLVLQLILGFLISHSKAFSLNAIVDVRRRRRQEIIFNISETTRVSKFKVRYHVAFDSLNSSTRNDVTIYFSKSHKSVHFGSCSSHDISINRFQTSIQF